MKIRHPLFLASACLFALALYVSLQRERTRQPTPTMSSPRSESAFLVWLDGLETADILADEQLLDRAIELASQRRERMRQLLATDPEAALDESIGFAAYEKLPPELQRLVEEPFTERADISVIAICDQDPQTPELEMQLNFKDGSRAALNASATARLGISKRNVPVQGIRLDGRAAIRPNVFQELDDEDLAWAVANLPSANPDAAIDFVSGEPMSDEPILALAGGYVFRFSDRSSLNRMERALRRLDALPGLEVGSSSFLAQLASKTAQSFDFEMFMQVQSEQSQAATLNTKQMLIIRVDFPDKPGAPHGSEQLENLVTSAVSPALAAYSYNKTSVEPTVTPNVYRLGESSIYDDESHQKLHQDAVEAYMANGYTDPLLAYDLVAVSFPQLGYFWAGLATVGGQEQWLQGEVGSDTILHELGHNYGLKHANYWAHDHADEASTNPVNPNGVDEEYGDVFDVMGDGAVSTGHFHMAAKQHLGWLEADQWHDLAAASDNGTYRIYSFDNAQATGPQALRVSKSATSDAYWVGYRKLFPGVPRFDRGAYLIWQRGEASPSGHNQSWLIDATPGSADGKLDAGLALGSTYSDLASNVHITPVSAGEDEVGHYLDLAVHFGDFPNNQAPTGTLSAPETGDARSLAQFSFSGSDPDGEDLAYHWDFGDGTVDTNSSSLAHAFSVGGDYTVTLTVSDMKGGTLELTTSIAVADPINEIFTRASETSSDLLTAAANDALVVVGGANGTFLSSSDGEDWTPSVLPGFTANVHIQQVIWTGNEFVAVGGETYAFNESQGVIFTSPDGLTWTKALQTDHKVGAWGFIGVAANDDASRLIAVGSDAKVYIRDVDSSWGAIDLGLAEDAWAEAASIVYAEGAFLIGGYDFSLAVPGGNPLVLLHSLDGEAWTDLSEESGLESWHGLSALALENGTLLGSGFNASLRYSDDGGATWITNEQGELREAIAFAYGNGVYSAHGLRIKQDQEDEPINLLSADGRNWHLAGSPPIIEASDVVAQYNDRVYFEGTFISVGDDGLIHQTASFGPAPHSPFETWILGYTSDEADQGANANPDNDWASNFMEFALGSDPTSAASAPRPPRWSWNSDGTLAVAIQRFETTDVDLSSEYSYDLVSWWPLDSIPTVDSATILELTSTTSFSAYERLFLRVSAKANVIE